MKKIIKALIRTILAITIFYGCFYLFSLILTIPDVIGYNWFGMATYILCSFILLIITIISLIFVF